MMFVSDEKLKKVITLFKEVPLAEEPPDHQAIMEMCELVVELAEDLKEERQNKQGAEYAYRQQQFYGDLGCKSGMLPLPNGCTLYWRENEVGGITYLSDEVGGGVFVWDTALVDSGTLLSAMVHHQAILHHQLLDEKEKEKEIDRAYRANEL